MTIAEIESTLRTLRIRHPNLDEELLVTLLTAGGWEEKVIKDAVSIFRSSANNNTTAKMAVDVVLPPDSITESTSSSEPVSTNILNVEKQENEILPHLDQRPIENKNPEPVELSHHDEQVVVPQEITYYNPEGEEEKIAPTFFETVQDVPKKEEVLNHQASEISPTVVKEADVPVYDLSEKNTIVEDMSHDKAGAGNLVVENNQSEANQAISEVQDNVQVNHLDQKENLVNISTQEPQSLIVPSNEQRVLPPEIVPPENLPLKPFESTPHIWPFSKYKEVFHGETMPPLHPEERELVNNQTTPQEVHKVKKIKLKRSGFDGEDEGLIFLSGTTLLIILLLLAYMYSNGRL